MKYYSIANKNYKKSFYEAVKEGPAPSGSLFFPEKIPRLSHSFFEQLPELSLQEVAFEVMKPYVAEDITENVLKDIVKNVFQFEIPLVKVEEDIFSLELFHGPTLAFKDVGAGFLAQVLKHSAKNEKIRILVATSGDTGGAVANAFYGLENVEVFVLYPKNKVSELQQKQFAGLSKNITSLRIDGTFDDCQRLVKTAFADADLSQKMNFNSANSINIARWIPQSIYYYWAIAQLNTLNPVSVCVPTGNLGNLSSGVLAAQTGLPINQFIAAANENDIIPAFLKSGEYAPKKSIETVANAMDVGNPNNFSRLLELFDNQVLEIQAYIQGASFSDEAIKQGIKELYKRTNYLSDPHGMTGYLALKKRKKSRNIGVFVETASYGKFEKTVSEAVGETITLPKELQSIESREIKFVDLSADFEKFKSFLSEVIA